MEMITPIFIPQENSRNGRSKSGATFVEITKVKVKGGIFKEEYIEKEEPECLNISEIIRFKKDPRSPIQNTDFLEVELIDDEIVIEGTRQEFAERIKKACANQ